MILTPLRMTRARRRGTNAACQSCHKVFVQTRAEHRAGANCVACHMPKRRTDDAVHIVMTDHKIVRVQPAGDLLAEKTEVQESPATSYRGEVLPLLPQAPGARTPMTCCTAPWPRLPIEAI